MVEAQRFLSNDANLVMCVRAEDYDALMAEVERLRKLLADAIEREKRQAAQKKWALDNLSRQNRAHSATDER